MRKTYLAGVLLATVSLVFSDVAMATHNDENSSAEQSAFGSNYNQRDRNSTGGYTNRWSWNPFSYGTWERNLNQERARGDAALGRAEQERSTGVSARQ